MPIKEFSAEEKKYVDYMDEMRMHMHTFLERISELELKNKELHDQINHLKDQITVLTNKLHDTEPFVTIDLDNPRHHAHALEEKKPKFNYAQYRVNI